jgi:uncharacterized protein DUF4255
MSNSLAIAAVTSTLQRMLDSSSGGLTKHLPDHLPSAWDIGNVTVTTKTPDKARAANTTNQVNIYLYQTAANAAFRNTDLPPKVRRGESAQPAVALTLYYLISAYGNNDEETAAQFLLGQVMRIFNDNAVLDREAIKNALIGNDLYEQIERVRLTPQPFSLEEISKLWTAFQTQYRISAAYQAEVVLIDSNLPARTAPPVLTRGAEDQGPSAVAGNSLPVITEVRPPNRQSSAQLGDEITITGANLNGLFEIRFTLINPRSAKALTISLPPAAARITQEGLKVTLPNDAAAHSTWVAGFYTIAVVVSRSANGTAQSWSSNELPLSLAPRLVKIAPPNPVARNVTDHVTLTLTCQPEIRLTPLDSTHMAFEQQVVLLLGSARQIPSEPPPAPPAFPTPPPARTGTVTFVFPIAAAEVGEYLVRLRVDGVDLPLVDRSVKPPVFHASQKVTIV